MKIMYASFALTEPKRAVMYLACHQQLLEKMGDEYILNGEKCFITNAKLCSFFVVFAKQT